MRPVFPVIPLVALFWPGAALAVRVPLSQPKLCAGADLVVIGEVTGTEGRWTTTGDIETHADVVVTRLVRGTRRDSIVVRTPGGQVGSLKQTISEAPVLRTDARYLLILEAHGDEWAIAGGADGVIPVPWGDPDAEAAAITALGSCRA